MLAWNKCKEATSVHHSSLKLLFEDLNLEYLFFWLKISMIHPEPGEDSSGGDWGQKCGSGAVKCDFCKVSQVHLMAFSSLGRHCLGCIRAKGVNNFCRNSLVEQRYLRVLVLVSFHPVSSVTASEEMKKKLNIHAALHF